MNLYISFVVFNIVMTVFSKNIDIKTDIEEPIPLSVGLKFIAEINNLNDEDCAVEIYPDECCLYNNDDKCNIVEIMGGANDVVSAGATKTFTMVAPLLDAYQRRGYCTVYVDSCPVSRPKAMTRDTVKIKFNTKLDKNTLPKTIQFCKLVDEDPLNDCNPVECDTYYNGKRSYYNTRKQRCVEVPTCLSTKTKVPKTMYNPVANKCIDKSALNIHDLDYVRDLSNTQTARRAKDVWILRVSSTTNTASQSSTPSPTVNLQSEELNEEELKEIAKQKYDAILQAKEKLKAKAKAKVKAKCKETVKSKFKTASDKAIAGARAKAKSFTQARAKLARKQKLEKFIQYLKCNKYTIMVLLSVSVMQCCLICTMVYCMTKNCLCRKKQVVKNYFNDKQDVSITTPLIGTSNIDTETTECQYMSESSNFIEKKIKCYKACQKDKLNNMKLSMSDDIISKCITRRNWRRFSQSDTIPEANINEYLKIPKRSQTDDERITESKVNFQDDNEDRVSNVRKITVKRDNINTKDIEKQFTNSSEKQIRCHTYNTENKLKLSNTTLQNNSQRRSTDISSQEKIKADSIAKSAQACFSNDSIDEFLSEKGIICIDDIATKCTNSFTSLSSAAKGTVSSPSSKTSKNKIVKNIMTLLPKKIKGPSSDPGIKKSETDLDLELLYVSRVSLASTFETDGGNDSKRPIGSTGATKTFTMIAPLLDPYQRKGYCTLFIDSHPVSRSRNVKRDTVKIAFNTNLKEEILPDRVTLCKHVDEDPLNNCSPVNCDYYYNGEKSYFCQTKHRCMDIPICLSKKLRIPKEIYNPISNKCSDSTINNVDLNYIKKLTKNHRKRMPKVTFNLNKINNGSYGQINTKSIPVQARDNYNKPSSNELVIKNKIKHVANDLNQETANTESVKPKTSNIHSLTNIKTKSSNKTHKTPDQIKVKTNAEVMQNPELAAKDEMTAPKTKIGMTTIKATAETKPTTISKLKNTCKISALYNVKHFLKEKLHHLIKCIECNKYTVLILPCVLILQCCLICTMLHCINKKRAAKRQPLIKKYFNYRQDVSVTTPLIGTSNIETETTEYQYTSESSNYIDKKIKCYKAIQRDRNNTTKLSMSDDILSKCITRRDWLRLPRSETIPEVKTDEESKVKKESRGAQKKLPTDMKVNFQEAYQDKVNKVIKSSNKRDGTFKNNENYLSDTSEKEIRCHSYNYENNSNVNSLCKTFGIYGQDKKKSDSTEKGAQANFSNDSIDEFLSERGLLFIGDNISKYSYTSLSSEARSSISNHSSKTSKNNIVRNVMTLLSKKIKGPSSDPGKKNPEGTELDLDLLKLSKASLSSSVEIEEGNDSKRIKDSTSSL